MAHYAVIYRTSKIKRPIFVKHTIEQKEIDNL